jgi:hypothetical protein
VPRSGSSDCFHFASHLLRHCRAGIGGTSGWARVPTPGTVWRARRTARGSWIIDRRATVGVGDENAGDTAWGCGRIEGLPVYRVMAVYWVRAVQPNSGAVSKLALLNNTGTNMKSCEPWDE